MTIANILVKSKTLAMQTSLNFWDYHYFSGQDVVFAIPLPAFPKGSHTHRLPDSSCAMGSFRKKRVRKGIR
jgi:hypothetical protein